MRSGVKGLETVFHWRKGESESGTEKRQKKITMWDGGDWSKVDVRVKKADTTPEGERRGYVACGMIWEGTSRGAGSRGGKGQTVSRRRVRPDTGRRLKDTIFHVR